jgi:hypothetical protein
MGERGEGKVERERRFLITQRDERKGGWIKRNHSSEEGNAEALKIAAH